MVTNLLFKLLSIMKEVCIHYIKIIKLISLKFIAFKKKKKRIEKFLVSFLK